MAKVDANKNVSAEYQIVNGKKVKKQESQQKQKQVFNNKGQKAPQKPNDSAVKQEVYKKSGYQLKDTKDASKPISLMVYGKMRTYKTVGTLTTGGRILVQDEKGAYHVVSHTKDNKLVMLKDDYAKNKIFYENTSAEHKVKIGKKSYVITNANRDRHGRMSAIDENGKRVVLSSDRKELKTSYVEAEDQRDSMNDYIAKATKGKSKDEAAKIRKQIMEGNSSYSNKGVLRFKASNGEVWYYDTKRKTYVKYSEKEAQAIIKDLDKGAKEDWGLFRTGLGTDYELLKNTNAQIIDPEVLNKVNKHYSAEYGNKVDKNAEYGSGKYRTAYEAFLASEIGDDEVYLFNATLVKNNAITDQSRRNEILQTNLTKISGFGIEGLQVGVNKRANRMAAADAASTKEDYQALQDAAEEENKKKNYKQQFKGQDALQTYISGVHDGDVQEIDDFNNALIDPKEDMLDRDEIVRIKAETGALWLKEGNFKKGFEEQDSDVTKQMFALQSPKGKAILDAKSLKTQAAEKHQEDYMMMARSDLYSDKELASKATQLLEAALHNLNNYHSTEFQMSTYSTTGGFNTNAPSKVVWLKNAEENISRAYSMIRNDKILAMVKKEMGDNYNLLVKREQEHLKTNNLKNVTGITDKQVTEYSDNKGEVKLTPEQIAHNKYVVTWLKAQLSDIERDKKFNEAKEGWKQDFVNETIGFVGGVTRASLANKYQLIKSNIARLEAAAEGKLVDTNGKPVSFDDAMKNLGDTGLQVLEQANGDYQSAQQIGEFVVDMVVLALPLPKSFNAANTVIKMGNALYKVISKSDKACKVVKITQEAAKGSKIYEVVTKVATKNPKLVENTRKVATIMNAAATGGMQMAAKTAILDATNIATSREGFTLDRISEMNEKVKGAAKFGAMGGAIGGSTAIASEYVSSVGAKYTVHGLGLVADLMGAAGLMTAESHGETNFWDNLRCVNPDGSFNFEQVSMTAMMIFGHLHGMSTVRGKVKPHVELQADGTFKAKLGNNELTLNNDGIWSDAESGREFRLAKDNNGRTQLAELTKKEVEARHSEQPVTEEARANSARHLEVPAEESHGTSSQQINSFKERINKAKTREELNAIRDDINKTDLTVQERNELMAESLKVQKEWSQAPERSHIVNMATEGEGFVMGKQELTALRNELGIKQSKPGLHFEGETDGANAIINEMKGNDTVNSYIVSRDVEGKAHIEYKVSYENGKATDVEFYDADGTIKSLPAEKKQAVLDELNKPAEADPVSHLEMQAEESQPKAEPKTEPKAVENVETPKADDVATDKKVENKESKPTNETRTVKETKPESTKPAEKPVIASESEAIQPKQNSAESTPVTTSQERVGNSAEQAVAIHNSEVETAGVTPVHQTKTQQLEIKRLQTLVQTKEGQVILADAMKDPNFGKPIRERVPQEGLNLTKDGRLQIEVDGVVYTKQNRDDFRLFSSDGKILEDHFGVEPERPSATDNPNITRLYRKSDGAIYCIENQYGAIDYRKTWQEYYPAGKPNTYLMLYKGYTFENHIITDNVGRVIGNNSRDSLSDTYFSKTKNGRTVSDFNIVSDLNQAIQDAKLKNTTFSTKNGRQKAYEEVRTQIDNAYNDNKLTGEDYENFVAKLNVKAEKSGGLLVRETRYQQLKATESKRYENNRDNLSNKIDKVATRSDYDNMVAEINEAVKSDKIDSNAAKILNKTLDAKGELIEGVETLSQKEAKIKTQVEEIETAQRIEKVSSQPVAEKSVIAEESQAKAEPRFSESNINFSRTHEGFSQIEGNVKDVPDLRNADSFRNSKDGVGVVYLPKTNATAIVVKISGRVNDNYTIMIDGKIPEEQCRALVKSLKDSGNNRFDRQQVADILNKQYEMAETSSVRPETHTEESQVKETSTANDKKLVVENKGEGEKPAVEPQAKEPAEKPAETKASETDPTRHSEHVSESSQSVTENSATGKKFNITTEDIPTKLSDMHEFVEKNKLNAVKNNDKDNVTNYSIKNDETGGVIHIQFIDGKRSNMTVVKANDLQIHIEFAEDGKTPSKVRTDFIDNDKIYTRVEDRTTGQVTFEEPITFNGERSPIGLAIESDSPIAKRFNEGSIDIEGNFTPKEVNEGPYQVIDLNPEGKPTKTALKGADGNVLEYNYNEYDNNGNVTKTTTKDVDGKVTASHDFEYDNNHNLTKETVKDAEGKITAIYDGEGNSLDIPAEKFAETNVESKPEPAKVEEGQTESVKPEAEPKAVEEAKPVEENFSTESKDSESVGIIIEFDDKPAEKSVIASESEAIQSKQNSAESTPVTTSQERAGNSAEQAAQIHNGEMNNVESTSTAQVKNLEKYETMFQTKEGKAVLDEAKNDPNFRKTVEERVPSDKIVKDADGNLQSIEVDGVTYTRNEQGEYINKKGDSQIQIETPDQNIYIFEDNVDKMIIIDKENKISKIKSKVSSDNNTINIDYDTSNGQPIKVSLLGGMSIDLSTGVYSQDYGSTCVDPSGRVIRNDPLIDINGRKYYPENAEGYRYEDWGRDQNGRYIGHEVREKTENSLSKQIEDAQLENRGLRTTKKAHQKTYEDVRNQIEDAYNNNKIDRETANNLHTKLNEKAKLNGLETLETPTMKAEREALAKWNEQVDSLKDSLMSEIEKVNSQAAHDQMVEKIGDICKNGKIDMKRANELYDALEAKANSIDGVESLAQKKAKIETLVREIETQHRTELLDEYLAGENLPSEIGTKEYYDEALSTIDRGVKSGLIEPQNAEVLRTQAKEQLAKLESESSQSVTEKSVIASESEAIQSKQKPAEDAVKKGVLILPDDELKPVQVKTSEEFAQEDRQPVQVKTSEEFAQEDRQPVQVKTPEELAQEDRQPVQVKTSEEFAQEDRQPVQVKTSEEFAQEDRQPVQVKTPEEFAQEDRQPVRVKTSEELTQKATEKVADSSVEPKAESNKPAETPKSAEETKVTKESLEQEINSLKTKDDISDYLAKLDEAKEKGILTEEEHLELTQKATEKVADSSVEPIANEEESATVESETQEPQGETGEVDAGQAESPEPVSTDNTTTPKKSMFDRLFHRSKAKNEDGTTIPKSLRGENGTGLKEGLVYDKDSKQYKETIQEGNKTTTTIYDANGQKLHTREETTTDGGSTIAVTKDYKYNAKGKLVSKEEISLDGVKTTEYTEKYNLVHESSYNNEQKLTIKYNDGYEQKVNGTEVASKEYTYQDGKFVSKKDGKIVETVEYNQKDHTWTIKDANGKVVESHDNMKISNKLRNTVKLASIAGAIGGIGYGISQAVNSEDEQNVEQQKVTTKPTAKPKPVTPKNETKVTLGDSEGTISADGTITIGGKAYPKNEDGTYTIDGKNYKLDDNKLVEVEPEVTDSTGTEGSSEASDGTQEVTGTIDGKNYSIKDGVVTIDGHDYDRSDDGYYNIDGVKYTTDADGKLVKVDGTKNSAETSTENDDADAETSQGERATRSANSATTVAPDITSQTGNSQGNDRDSSSHSDTTTVRRSGNGSVVTGGASSSRDNAGVTPHEERQTRQITPTTSGDAVPVTAPQSQDLVPDETSGVVEPTDAQKQVAKTLQDEISGISTQADVQAFFTKLTSAVKNGQITIMQSDELLNLVKDHVETLVEVDRAQNEQDAIQKPEFGLGEVPTQQQPQRKEKRDITPMERMELTERIRKANTRDDIAKIQQEMRKYKVFPGRKNLRRAYKAKLRAIKHQGDEKYEKRFNERMEKIEKSDVYIKDKNSEFMKRNDNVDDIANIDKDIRKGFFEA